MPERKLGINPESPTRVVASQGVGSRHVDLASERCEMKRLSPLFMALSALAGPQAVSDAEATEVPVPVVLAQLHAQLEQVRSQRPGQRPAALNRVPLDALAGISRDRLVAALGVADYCDPPNDESCRHSMHWAYFFYQWSQTVRETGDAVEISIPIQGWAMEVRFGQSSAIKSATWTWQE